MSDEETKQPKRITLAEAMELANVSRSTLMRNRGFFDPVEELQPVIQTQPVLMLDREKFLAWVRARGKQQVPED